MGKTAIVLGATGLVGQSLTDQLAKADHVGKIITLTRRPAPHASANVHNQVLDFDQLERHAAAFSGDLLFSCLGTTRKEAGSINAQRVVDLTYQYRAAQMAANHGVRHYLLVSSSGANADSQNPYLRMKGELEQRVQTLSFERISIFQPSLLLGQRGDFRLGEKLGGWILPTLCAMPGLRRFRPIAGEQVAAKMVRVSRQPGKALEWYRLDEISAR
ncbi:MAG: NAD(P)H-binding protein [Desulfosarcina sp.]